MNNQTVLRTLQGRIGSADWSKWQIHRWQFYDYVRYTAAGVAQLTFFANPLGSTDPVSALAKTLEQTNVPKARTFGQVYFIINQIRTHIMIVPRARQVAAVTNVTDWLFVAAHTALTTLINDLSHQGVLNIKIGQKDYFDIDQPFTNCPPGFGIHINQWCGVTAATAGAVKVFRQSPNAEDVYDVSPPQMVEPEQTIEATIDFPNGNTPSIAGLVGPPVVDIGLIFDGYIARPAQ